MFSIILATYNRQEMLKGAIQSILNQTYKNYEVFVLDRGSEPSVEPIIKALKDNRFKYIRSSQEIHGVDAGNEILKIVKGDYFLNFADDDALAPTALEKVKRAFEENPDCGIIQTHMVAYNHTLEKQEIDIYKLFMYSRTKKSRSIPWGHFAKIDGKDFTINFVTQQYIGSKCKPEVFTSFHPSSIFLRMKNVREIFDKQQGLFVKPFGDTGYAGLSWYTKLGYINEPLTITGFGHLTETFKMKGVDFRKQNELKNLEYAPLKIPTILNLCADGSLKVIYRNGIDKQYKTYIRPGFFFEIYFQLKEERNKTYIKEVEPLFYRNLILHFPSFIEYLFKNNCKQLQKIFLYGSLDNIKKRILRKTKLKYLISHETKNELKFNNIAEFAIFVDNMNQLLKGKIKISDKTVKKVNTKAYSEMQTSAEKLGYKLSNKVSLSIVLAREQLYKYKMDLK